MPPMAFFKSTPNTIDICILLIYQFCLDLENSTKGYRLLYSVNHHDSISTPIKSIYDVILLDI